MCCIDYLGFDKSKLSYLRLGVIGRNKILIWVMTTYLELEFQIYSLICCLVTAFQRTVNLLSYSNFLIEFVSNILIKDSLFLNVMK